MSFLRLLQDAAESIERARNHRVDEAAFDEVKVARGIAWLRKDAYAEGLRDGERREKRIGSIPDSLLGAYLAGFAMSYTKPKMGRPRKATVA